jgi:hypothetical protein
MASNNQSHTDQQFNLEDLISLHEAAQISGLSHGHLALLIRRGQLWGKNWGGTG